MEMKGKLVIKERSKEVSRNKITFDINQSQPNHEYLTQQVKEMRLNEEYAFDNSANTLQIEQRPCKSNYALSPQIKKSSGKTEGIGASGISCFLEPNSLVFVDRDEQSILKQKKLEQQRQIRKALEQQIIEKKMIKDEENRKLAEQEQKDEQRLRTEFNNQLSKINDETLNNKYKYKRPSKLDPQFIQSQFSIENPNDEASNGNCALESSDKVADHINLNKTISLNELKTTGSKKLSKLLNSANLSCVQSPVRQAEVRNSKNKLRRASVGYLENEDQVFTPYLNANGLDYKQLRDSYLDQYEESNGAAMSNHLYKYVNKIVKREDFNDVNQNMGNISILPNDTTQNEQYKAQAELLSKRILQRTPISSNLIKFKKNYKLESPAGHKLNAHPSTHSSGKESLTTATSIRKISGKMKISSEAPSNTESRCESISTDIESKILRAPNTNDKGLIKKSLERIDNAVNRNTKMIYSNEICPFEVSNGINSHLRVYLENQEDSTQESIQMHSVPFAGINLYAKNQAQSNKGSNSVVYESDTQDIDNFTLGPKQFGDLVAESKMKKNSSLMPKLIKGEEKSRNITNIKGYVKSEAVKYLSADKILSQKNASNNEFLRNQIYFKNPKLYENPFITLNNQNDQTKRNRQFVQETHQVSPNKIIFDRVNRNSHCESTIPSLSSTMNKFSINDTENLESTETRKSKQKLNGNKVYYSHSPPMRTNDGGIMGSNFKMKSGKLNEHRVSKQKEGSKLQIMQKRIVKAGPNAKKFPKDFF